MSSKLSIGLHAVVDEEVDGRNVSDCRMIESINNPRPETSNVELNQHNRMRCRYEFPLLS